MCVDRDQRVTAASYSLLVVDVVDAEHAQDFWETIVHHLTTVSLMMMSWTANMVRMGTLILCVHDAVDYFLEVRTSAL